MTKDEWEELYAEMLEWRQQMYEGVPFACIYFWQALDKLRESRPLS